MKIANPFPSCNDGLPLFAWALARRDRVSSYAARVIARKAAMPLHRAQLVATLAGIGRDGR